MRCRQDGGFPSQYLRRTDWERRRPGGGSDGLRPVRYRADHENAFVVRQCL